MVPPEVDDEIRLRGWRRLLVGVRGGPNIRGLYISPTTSRARFIRSLKEFCTDGHPGGGFATEHDDIAGYTPYDDPSDPVFLVLWEVP